MLHNLGFLISTRKSTLDPTSTLEFLGVLVDSEKMTLSLLQEKVEKIKTQCKELSKLIGWLSSTAVATFPAPLPYRTLIHQKIQEMISKSSLYLQLSLSKQAREELHWWIQNLSFYKGKFLISPPAQLIYQFRVGGIMPRENNRSFMKKSHINVLELKADKVEIMNFTIAKRKRISIQNFHSGWTT